MVATLTAGAVVDSTQVTEVISDHGYQWWMTKGGEVADRPARVRCKPECEFYLDPVKVPGPSCDRHAPTRGALRGGDERRQSRRVSFRKGTQLKTVVLLRKRQLEEWDVTERAKTHDGKSWSLQEMEQEICNPESDLRKRIDEGQQKGSSWDLGPEFENAHTLAQDVQRDQLEERIRRSACPANSRQLMLLDSGASDNMIGRSLLTRAEQDSIYKVEPKSYELAAGTYTLEDAVKLWIPFLEDMVEFYVSDSTNTPMLSEGKICKDHGCSTRRNAGSVQSRLRALRERS